VAQLEKQHESRMNKIDKEKEDKIKVCSLLIFLASQININSNMILRL
jgi:hypothetical protein